MAKQISFKGIFEQGSDLWALIPVFSDNIMKITLEGVERGGIWIQSQELTDAMLRAVNRSSFPATPVIFVPYSAIRYAYTLAEGPALSAEQLGL